MRALPASPPGLALREFTPGDVEDIIRLDGDPAVMRFIGDGRVAGGRPDAVAAIARVLLRYEERPGTGAWHTTRLHDGAFVGWVSLKPCGESADIEVGYRLVPQAWGRGHATALARAALQHGFRVMALARIIAVTHPGNLASQRVLAKSGLRDEGWGHYYGRDLRLFAAYSEAWPS